MCSSVSWREISVEKVRPPLNRLRKKYTPLNWLRKKYTTPLHSSTPPHKICTFLGPFMNLLMTGRGVWSSLIISNPLAGVGPGPLKMSADTNMSSALLTKYRVSCFYLISMYIVHIVDNTMLFGHFYSSMKHIMMILVWFGWFLVLSVAILAAILDLIHDDVIIIITLGWVNTP